MANSTSLGNLVGLSARFAILATGILFLAFCVPTPYLLNAPGRAEDLRTVVRVADHPPHTAATFLLTTVLYEKANLLFCLYALLDRDAQLLPADYHPPVRSFQARRLEPGELEFPLDGSMEQSKHLAVLAALRYKGYKVTHRRSGVRVVGLAEQLLGHTTLCVGDVVTAIDGKPVRSMHALQATLGRRTPGTEVRVQVKRNQKQLLLRARLFRAHQRTVLGVIGQDETAPPELPVKVDIEARNVVGASGGLLFALQIVDSLSSSALCPGQKVAGTGTLDAEGRVGPIEGTSLKLAAAYRAGAGIFLVPAENAPELSASPYAKRLRIVPVSTLAEAVRALQP